MIDEFADTIENAAQPLCSGTASRIDRATANPLQALPLLGNQAESGFTQSGVDTQNKDRFSDGNGALQ